MGNGTPERIKGRARCAGRQGNLFKISDIFFENDFPLARI